MRFHEVIEADGRVSVSMSEEAPNTFKSTPLDLVLREGHTTLEVFLALAPSETPPASLLAAHELEAHLLARPTNAIVTAHFDRNAPIEKSVASCEDFVWANPADWSCHINTWGNHRQAHNISGDKGLHVGQYWAYSTTLNVTLGICNESNVDIKGRIGVDRGGDDSSAYSYRGWATVKPGYKWRWFNFSDTNEDDCSNVKPGDLCLALPLPSRYRVDGSSATGKLYHLKTAELVSTLKPECEPK